MSDPIPRLNAALEGRYRIERELGEGGMATVYLARDERHNRNVALKVLKPELAAVVGAERFLAEIETTAALQHPHILPLFDSGEADGFLFYVMPYVEGETLRERIDREKQLPVDEALGIAAAVAGALQTAHEKGVVHRDIKPGNILLSQGEPLVADFGIAIAVSAGGGGRLTETGLSLGTPYYMSPEQATGDQAVGPASDTFALACVLYEMLTGEPPYPGNTAQAVLGKIIQGTPVSATDVRRTVPANVDAAIRKALEKLPADRFSSVRDFARALGDPGFTHGSDEVRLGTAGGWNALSRGLAASTLLFAAIAAWALLRSPATPSPAIAERYQLATEESWPVGVSFALSPDGSAVVHRVNATVGVLGLYLRRWDNLESTLIPGTDQGNPLWPVFSPGSDEVAYMSGGELRVSPLVGGISRTLVDSAACCPRWADDGFIYYSGTPGPAIYRVPAQGGAKERVTPDDVGLRYPRFFTPLRNGRAGVMASSAEPEVIATIDLESGEWEVLTPGLSPVLLPDGTLLFGTADGDVVAAPFNETTLSLDGPAVPIVEDVVVTSANNGVSLFSASPSGTFTYWTGSGQAPRRQFVWVTRSGEVTPVDEAWTFDRGDTNAGWQLSPDDTRVALRALTDEGYDIWIKELDDGPLSRLTIDRASERMPRWSPDGRMITYVSNRGGRFEDVYTEPADGTGEPELLFQLDRGLAQAFWTPDGAWLVLRTLGLSNVIGGRDILALPASLEGDPIPLMDGAFDEGAPAVSEDSRWIAYNSTETGRYEVFLRPFPEVSAAKVQVSTNGGAGPLWSHSGDELYFVDGANRMIAAHLDLSSDRPRVLDREVLFEMPPGFEGGLPNNYIAGLYDITSDDQRFLMVRPFEDPEVEGPQARFIVVRNWFTELRARLGEN